MTETELWDWMMQGNYPPGYPDIERPELVPLERRATAILSRDLEYEEEVRRKVITPAMRRKGKTTRQIKKTLRAGTKVKVTMASRMGDVGITPNLDADQGYCVRIPCVEGEWDMLGDGSVMIPQQPAGILTEIEHIEDPRSDKVAIAFPPDSE